MFRFITICFSLWFFTAAAWANADALQPEVDEAAVHNARTQWVNEAESGVFLLGNGADLKPSLLLSSDVDVVVNGPVAKVQLTQKFYNSGTAFAEGLYVFPLPENAAVSAMQMLLGERRIVGEIKEKAEAKRIYAEARQAGKQAALLEQRRPNLFTSAVANIAAGESIEVRIEYTQLLDVNGAEIGLRLPMTLTPRYSPVLKQDDNSAGIFRTAEAMPLSNRASINISIDAQLALTHIESSSHNIQQRLNQQAYSVTTKKPWVPMDRDFHLSWKLAATADVQTAFYHEQVAGEHYGLMMFVPSPQAARNDEPHDPAREVILIIDTSGSMGGEAIRQAKASLLQALKHLSEEDRFNIIEFNSTYQLLFSETQVANAANLRTAKRFIRGLDADGGTEMLPAITEALNMAGSESLLRQIVFITDGSVSNEEQIFAAIHQMLGRGRLFTVGIGSAPNSYFMRKAAEFGRGSFTHVNSENAVLEQMSHLLKKLKSPVLRDLALELPEGVTAETWPAKLPDIYVGEPVLVSMKLNTLPTDIKVSGFAADYWEQNLNLDRSQPHSSVATLWARRKIEALMDKQIKSRETDSQRQAIVDVALAHQLMTQYTSFVAVDKTPIRKVDEALKSEQVANMQRKGAAYPGTALGTAQQLLMSLLLLLISACFWWTRRPVAQ